MLDTKKSGILSHWTIIEKKYNSCFMKRLMRPKYRKQKRVKVESSMTVRPFSLGLGSATIGGIVTNTAGTI
eukprot:snap_masked-scaffold_14-processed-gene-1.6-mRNA-1 protein AED:1.00 eAED:1.00 QI:0/0/0/0/1/1/2/0/70